MIGAYPSPIQSSFGALWKTIPYEVNETLYVGDRLDNDIDPAVTMGLQTALIRRGPWAFIQQPDVERPHDAGRLPR